MTSVEDVRQELRSKLRGRAGLTPAKLNDCPNLQFLLGGSAPEAYVKLVQAVRDLGADQDARALRNALNVDTEHTGLLGERRRKFGDASGKRDAETVEVWENRAIDALLLRLVPDEGGYVAHSMAITAFVYGPQTVRVNTAKTEIWNGQTTAGREPLSRELVKAAVNPNWFSLPALIYKPEWKLAELSLIVRFLEPWLPSAIWFYKHQDLQAVTIGGDQPGRRFLTLTDDSSDGSAYVSLTLQNPPDEYLSIAWVPFGMPTNVERTIEAEKILSAQFRFTR